MLSDFTIFDDVSVGMCKTGKVSSVTGECTANIRKGKTIFYYELEVKVPWEGMRIPRLPLCFSFPFLTHSLPQPRPTTSPFPPFLLWLDGVGAKRKGKKEITRTYPPPFIHFFSSS